MGVQQSGCRLLRSPVRACHTGERVSGTPGSMERRVHQSSSAAAQQDSAASDTAATPSRSLSRRYPQRGPPQLIRGSSQQIAVSQPAMYPPSALERVGRDVRVLILQCLTSRHKLTAVARLNHCFRPLPALAFLRDTIDALLPGAVQACYAERTATGQLSMLSLWVMQDEQPGRSTLFTCPRSLCSLPYVAALRLLSVQLPDRTEATASLRCILRSVLLLPSLTSLDILVFRQPSGCYGVPQLDWTDDTLPSPAWLRHLTLKRLSLSAASFRRLCFLPLESLTMHDCTVLPGKDTPAAEAEQPSASVLQQLAYVGSPSRALVSAIGSYALQLRELVLTVCIVVQRPSPAWDFSPLMTEAGAARLPHLTKLSLSTAWDGTSEYSWQPELEQACTAARQQLVAAYSAQLTSLHVEVLSAASVSSWLHLLFSRCDRLDDLSVEAGLPRWTHHPLELQLESAETGDALSLPNLKKLTMTRLPLTDGGLLSVLSRCPHLQRCSLVDFKHVTRAGEEAALRCCPKLTAVST